MRTTMKMIYRIGIKPAESDGEGELQRDPRLAR
jgi:hypothetical protein